MRKTKNALSISFLFLLLFISCKNEVAQKKELLALKKDTIKEYPENIKRNISLEFKNYWYDGTAEITSYELKQARYGEMRDGKAVLIYVTEPFLSKKQVKADGRNTTNIPVLKLNSTKKYLTGIYPYSIMSSSFYPVSDNQHAIKVSFSAQEWCGHVYGQINNREDFEVTSHSYFESEADQNFTFSKEFLENELWNKIRINPSNLPIGDFKMIPSLEYIRLSHKEFKAYKVTAFLENKKNSSYYSISYPELERTLTIQFSKAFPYTIEGWKETFNSGFGKNKKELTSTAKKIKTIKSPYWSKNSNKNLPLRNTLGL